ncbi:hypothetical protein PFNF54_05525 [Plasmodium falciparum NF54]|uniref:Uncharacterized protein n=1 Tax=Plasmodium falciparum (isolate NF54) TaxID=5843 RepID=W7JLU5_PLAFO|nr:hypothetical protein PFNF54_05525 [Plasmodium falciparum NF54]
MIFKSVRNLSNKVCDVLVSFGVRQNKTTFISHPGIYNKKKKKYDLSEKKENDDLIELEEPLT